MMKNKKSLIAIIALVLVVVIGATFAYFQSTATFQNLFTAGIYKVVTTEVFESPTNWAPGEEITKTITSTNEGTIPAAVRVSLTEEWLDANNQDITSQITDGTVIINYDNTNDWVKEGNHYYYKYILNPTETTTTFIKSVTLNANINDVQCTTSQDGKTQSCEANNPALGAKYKLIITKETVQADKYKEVWHTNVDITERTQAITFVSRQNEGQITPGDVVGIGETEDFYVLSTNPTTTVLLAKYNLLVGNSYGERTLPGYGLQSEEAVAGYAWAGETFVRYGWVNFSYTNYWYENNLISPYNENNTIYYDTNNYEYRNRTNNSTAYPYVYDNRFLTAPDFTTPFDWETKTGWYYEPGYSIAYYVEQYKNTLISMGAPSTITGRLLTYEEAEANKDLGKNGYDSVIYNGIMTYWLGTAYDEDSAYVAVGEYNYITDFTYDGQDAGVRPVIEIPTSELH